MSTTGERIRARRILFELTVKAVADYAGVKPPTVSQWESDLMLPKGESMKRLEEILKTNSDWILYGKGNPDARYVLVQPDSQEFKAISLSTKRIPVLSWVQAGAWNDIGCDDPAMTCTEWTETSADVSDHAFALMIRGDSMFNPNDRRSLADGIMVVVDTVFNSDPESLNHKIVVAMLEGTNEATIKEFVKDGPNIYLNPLNPRYPIMPIDSNCRIVAVAKEGKIKL